MSLAEQKSSSKALPIHDALIQRRKVAQEDDWHLAELLYKLRRYELWRFATGGIESWDDYLKQPEIGISRHKADKLIRIYEYYIVNLGYSPNDLVGVPWYALDYISKKEPAVEKMQELLDSGRLLTQKDFKENYFDITESETGRDRTYTFVLMKKCDQTGTLEKVHDITSQQIQEALNL